MPASTTARPVPMTFGDDFEFHFDGLIDDGVGFDAWCVRPPRARTSATRAKTRLVEISSRRTDTVMNERGFVLGRRED